MVRSRLKPFILCLGQIVPLLLPKQSLNLTSVGSVRSIVSATRCVRSNSVVAPLPLVIRFRCQEAVVGLTCARSVKLTHGVYDSLRVDHLLLVVAL